LELQSSQAHNRFVNELEGICGDLTGNGLVNTADVSLFRRFLAGTSVLSPTAESRCTAIGPLGPCDLLDLVVIRRALAVPPLGPGIAGSCDALAGL
ncbi:MAG: hypothetical protein ACE5EV_05690, partial [Gaiellales bacterium]